MKDMPIFISFVPKHTPNTIDFSGSHDLNPLLRRMPRSLDATTLFTPTGLIGVIARTLSGMQTMRPKYA
jgi:hypothetical protein